MPSFFCTEYSRDNLAGIDYTTQKFLVANLASSIIIKFSEVATPVSGLSSSCLGAALIDVIDLIDATDV
jgi:hypothetical protein